MKALALNLVFVSVLSLAAAPLQAATLIHTNDLLGDIEPCGCRTNPQGGMIRKSNLIQKLTDSSLLQLDAGDLFFSSKTLPELLAKQSILQAEYLLKSMEQIHHDAVVPGEKDFALGLKVFEKLTKKSKVKFLAANLVRQNGGKIFEKSVVFTRKTADGKALKIAVIGLVGEDLGYPRELKILPPIATAKKEVAAARKKADLVILLTHQGLEKDKELAHAVPRIDIIVGGHSQSFLQEPIKIGTTMIYQSSFRNQYLGVLPLQKPFTGADYKLVGLDAGYDSPLGTPSKMDALVKEFKAAISDLNSKEEAKLTSVSAPNSHAGKFQTFPRCAECHLKQFDFWRKTNHALALNSLIEKQQFKNKECLSCHTVGLGDPQGFSVVNHLAETQTDPLESEDLAKYLKVIHDAKSLQDPVKISPLQAEPQPIRQSLSALKHSWTPVQCENCHQPGRDHPFSGGYSKKVEKTLCLNCHTAERAPEWYGTDGKPNWAKIEAKHASVTCPAGELTESEE